MLKAALFALIFSSNLAFARVGDSETSWAATDAQILAAPQQRLAPFSDAEIDVWLTLEYPRTFGTKAAVKGFLFEDENVRLIEAFRKLTDGQKMADRQSSCETVKCAAKEVFGEKIGLQLLFMIERFGFNGSHLTVQNADAWKSEELDQVLLGLSLFPEHTFPQRLIRPLFHFKRGFGPANYSDEDMKGLVADATIRLFDYWNDHTDAQKRYAIFHEVAHVLAHWSGDADLQDAWKNIEGGWLNEGKKWTAKKPEALVSQNARLNPQEDFAEALSAYRFNPVALKKASQKKYDLMKERFFDGLEYDSVAASQPEKAVSEKFLRENNSMIPLTLDDGVNAKVDLRCGRMILDHLGELYFSAGSDPAIDACAGEAIKIAGVDRAIRSRWPTRAYPIQVLSLPYSISAVSVSRPLKQQAVDRLVEDLKTILIQTAQMIYADAMSIFQGSCIDATKYSDQAVDRVSKDFTRRFGPDAHNLSYRYQARLKSVMMPVCEALKASSGGQATVSDAPVRSQISRFLLSSDRPG